MYQFWYNYFVNDEFRLRVVFYKSEHGDEPVREWLKSLSSEDRKTIGEDIKTVQFGWPLGMPVVRKIEPGIWEVRSNLKNRIARTLFTIEGNVMVLLHGFIKKTQKTPQNELEVAQRRVQKILGWRMKEEHIGTDFDDFLEEEGYLAAAEAVAIKRVIAYQIEQMMTEQNITKTLMAERMNTSRAALNRLLDPKNKSVTLQTLERAASALGKKLQIELV
jgi:phage-related protein/DNA-binding Xre family transcriptional regulator